MATTLPLISRQRQRTGPPEVFTVASSPSAKVLLLIMASRWSCVPAIPLHTSAAPVTEDACLGAALMANRRSEAGKNGSCPSCGFVGTPKVDLGTGFSSGAVLFWPVV